MPRSKMSPHLFDGLGFGWMPMIRVTWPENGKERQERTVEACRCQWFSGFDLERFQRAAGCVTVETTPALAAIIMILVRSGALRLC